MTLLFGLSPSAKERGVCPASVLVILGAGDWAA